MRSAADRDGWRGQAAGRGTGRTHGGADRAAQVHGSRKPLIGVTVAVDVLPMVAPWAREKEPGLALMLNPEVPTGLAA